jgi:hypothetical protein
MCREDKIELSEYGQINTVNKKSTCLLLFGMSGWIQTEIFFLLVLTDLSALLLQIKAEELRQMWSRCSTNKFSSLLPRNQE